MKHVSLTNAAELRIGVTYLSAPNPSLSIIQKTTDYLNTHHQHVHPRQHQQPDAYQDLTTRQQREYVQKI